MTKTSLFIFSFLILGFSLKCKFDPENQHAKSVPQPSSLEAKFKHAFGEKYRKHEIMELLHGKLQVFPEKTRISNYQIDKETTWSVQYTLNSTLQKKIEQIFKTSKASYGAFVAMDPSSGKVLSMVSFGKPDTNMTLKSSFPAASVFKVITAASALESGRLKHNSLIPVVGSYHTLYKRNIFKAGGINPNEHPRYAKLITFADALGKSVNSVFGKVGIFGVGEENILKTAQKFGFNQPIPFELDVAPSAVNAPTNEYELAETASGFTRENTMSPLHGAMIASAIANNGILMEPAIIDRIYDQDGALAYELNPNMMNRSIDPSTADELRIMLSRTITDGTSRGSFRGFQRSPALADTYIGGKTGTLNGWDPPGRYDWFVGFAEQGESKLALSVLCIHGSKRGMKASKIAREAFETYFNTTIARNELRSIRRK